MPEEYDGPGSGGIATEDMANLPDVLLGALMPIIKEYYRNLFLERTAHAKTLKVFQATLDGGLPEGRLIVNSDGWQIIAERPPKTTGEEELTGERTNPLELLDVKPPAFASFICVGCLKAIQPGQEIITLPGHYFHPHCVAPEESQNGFTDALEALKPAH